MSKLNLQARSTHSHSVTEYHLYTINEDFFKLTKKELTDLVQVGEVLIFKSHLDEQGTLIKTSDVEMYQEVVVHTEVRRQNNPKLTHNSSRSFIIYDRNTGYGRRRRDTLFFRTRYGNG